MSQYSDLSAYVKTSYGNINKMLREEDTLQRLFPFLQRPIVSDYYEEPVELDYEQGFTRAGNLAQPDLRPSVSAGAERAKIRPSTMIGRKRVGLRDQYRQGQEGYASFVSEHQNRITMLSLGGRRMIELDLMHGQSPTGIGVVESIGSTVSSVTPIVLTAATFQIGIFAGSKNMPVNFFDTTLATLRHSDNYIVSFDQDTRTVNVYGTVSSIIIGDVLFPDCQTTGTTGTPAGNQMLGLMAAAATTSGTVNNINVATNYLYSPTQYDCLSGPLTMEKVLKGVEKGVPKGVSGSQMLLIAPEHYGPLNNQLMALRQLDSSYSPQKVVNGVEGIEYRYSRGKMIVAVHLYMKPSEAVLIPYEETGGAEDRSIGRIGSTDLTFQDYEKPDANGQGGNIFFPLQDVAANEMRVFSDQALFIRKLGRVVRFKNIVNA